MILDAEVIEQRFGAALLTHHGDEASGGDKDRMQYRVSLFKMKYRILRQQDMSFSTATSKQTPIGHSLRVNMGTSNVYTVNVIAPFHSIRFFCSKGKSPHYRIGLLARPSWYRLRSQLVFTR
jgi:hypothetical protein